MKRVDYIIVGFGLAGATLSMELIRQGKLLLIFDQPNNNRASSVAAGLFNPVTGKLMQKSWNAERLFPALQKFYPAAEKFLGASFFFSHSIYRPFVSAGEQNEWMGKSSDESLKSFIEKIYTNSTFGSQVNDPFGGLLLKSCGYVDVQVYLKSIRDYLFNCNSYRETMFDFRQLSLDEDSVNYKEVAAEKIIFCEGIHVLRNPFFGWVPVRPLKGEILEIQLDEKPEVIFNRGVYVVPGREGLFNVGATYETKNLIEQVTKPARQELEERLKDLIKIPYSVNNQNWGIRPTVNDRKPMLGEHPEHKNVVIFNGLGTKGVSLAPYYANQLAKWLNGEVELDTEVNITRFKSLYSKF